MKEPAGAECQCIACHVIFGSIRSFDRHQDWKGRGNTASVICKSPQKIGLKKRIRREGVVVWVDPVEEQQTAHLHATVSV